MQGTSLRSDIQGPTGSFRCQLLVYPTGTSGASNSVANALAAFVELIPPASVAETSWACKDVMYGIAARSTESHTAEVTRQDTFTFDKSGNDRGWHDIIRWNDSKWATTTSICVCAEVRGLPVANSLVSDVRFVDFEEVLQPVAFDLPEGCRLFFDQRLLVARSDYFREMFSESKWLEGQKQVVDLSTDQLASKGAISAIFRFIISGSFQAEGDVDLAFAVRALGDRYCLKELVKLADSELLGLLCPENCLSLLGRLSGTNSSIELACWKMIQADGCKLLEQQEQQLHQLIEENPSLAKQLILLNVKSSRKRPRK